MNDNYRKLAEECDRAETGLRDQVDRNVTVHLRARQADIYERAIRKAIQLLAGPSVGDHLFALLALEDALKRAEKLK